MAPPASEAARASGGDPASSGARTFGRGERGRSGGGRRPRRGSGARSSLDGEQVRGGRVGSAYGADAHKAGTLEVVNKYVPGSNAEVLSRAYDELIRIRGFGVNGDMNETNLKIAHDLALQNKQITQAVPLEQWIDLRFQQRALDSLGRFAG